MKINFQAERVLEGLTGEEWETPAQGNTKKDLEDCIEDTGDTTIVRIP